MSWANRAAVNLVGEHLANLREGEEGALIIGYGAHGPSVDCPKGHVSVTITKSGETAIGEAVSLQDAIYLARGKVNAQIAARDKKREEDKAAA